MFNALVHNVQSNPPVLKLQYLIGALTGDAAKRLKNTKVTAKNYEGAWSSLIKKYDNKRVLLAAHMNHIIACPPATKKSAAEIERILELVQESRRGMQNLDCPVESWSSWFVQFTVHKLDSTTREDWERSLGDDNDFPDFEKLTKFLENYVRALDSAHANDRPTNQPAEAARSEKNRTQKTTKVHSATTESQPLKRPARSCPMCQESHGLSTCDKYKRMSVEQRRAFIIDRKLCENCLKINHIADNCRAPGRCFLCQSKHHTSVHTGEPQGSSKRPGNTTTPSVTAIPVVAHTPSAARTYTVAAHQRVLLATALVELQNERGTTVTARALLDQGAEFSLVTEQVAQCLALPRRDVDIAVMGIGAVSPGSVRSVVSLKLRSPGNPSFNIDMEALVLKKLTALIPSSKIMAPNYSHLLGLTLADPDFDKPGKIDCIIGAELYARLLTGKIVHGSAEEPTAQETVFGWVLSGPVASLDSSVNHVTTGTYHVRGDWTLHDSLQALWKIKEPPSPTRMSPQEEWCVIHFKKNYSRAPDGRFIVRLPIAPASPKLGDSKSIAIARWVQTERRHARDPVLAKLYRDFMLEYLDLGHMEEVGAEEIQPDLAYYMPHHGVRRQQGSTPKIRVVFNASQKLS